MDERDRIQKMVHDGKITEKEAQALVAVLSEIDEASASLERTTRSIDLEVEAVGGAGAPPEGVPGAAASPSHPPTPQMERGPMHEAPASVESGSVAPASVESGSVAPASVESGSVTPASVQHEPAAEGDGPADDGPDEPEWADDLRHAVDAAGRAAGQAMTDVGRAVGEVSRAVFGGAGQGAATGAASGAAVDGAEPAASSYDCAPEGTKWLRLSLVASELSIEADASVTEPVISGDIELVKLEQTTYGFLVTRSDPADRGEWSIPFLTHFPKTKLSIRLPADMGVEARLTAGELSLIDVPYLRGKLTAGDVSARNLRGMDFTTAAGDVDVEVTPRRGRHRLQASAGDVNVVLLPGSDVTLMGTVSIGEASVTGQGLRSERRGLGRRVAGQLGSGEARLDLKLTTGDLSVTARDA